MSNRLAILCETTIRWTLYTVVLVTPLIFIPATFELFEFPKMMTVYTGAILVGTAWIVRCFAVRRVLYQRTPFDFALALFLGAHILATLFSIDPHTSLFGYYTRFNGGLLSTISYLTLFGASVTFLSGSKARRLLAFIVISTVLVTLWGLPTKFGLDPSCFVINRSFTNPCWSVNFNPMYRVFSTLGQPNWLASFLILTGPLVVYGAYLSKGMRRMFLAGMVFCMTILLFWTQSRGGLAGLVVILILALGAAVLRVHHRAARLGLLIGGVGILVFISSALWQLISTRMDTIVIRKSVWDGALQVFRHYPLLGSGVETFAYAFDQFRPLSHLSTPEWDFIYNKAHNEFLNLLATTGAVGFASYMVLLGTILWFLIQRVRMGTQSVRFLSLAAFLGIVGYVVTIFFGFSVVPVSLLLFLIPAVVFGLSDDSLKDQRTFMKYPEGRKHILHRMGQIATGLLGLVLLFQVITMIRSDLFFAEGKRAMASGGSGALTALAHAVALAPYEPTYLDDFAFTAAVTAQNSEPEEQELLVALAAAHIERALAISPHNVTLWKTAQQVYAQLANVDPKFASTSAHAAQQIVVMAPNDIRAKMTLATMLLESKAPSSRAQVYDLIRESVIKKPDFAEGWYSLALLEFERDATPSAVRAMEQVVKHIPNHYKAQEYLKIWATQSAR